ncbi:putative hydrolase of the HAD superfamily [Halomicrobium zhouii]|uniref:Putative hydrolase of the HAD superfamily n=1 Tax=Halomicrobium zhouii TaxID=767519 RepID=A0A1I6KRC4_9EURY|nr:HAD family hydrolase [Halomicrobium zhouii]SFR93793.1 putative hydrolase of the HAD superfamily [Halomicrobium zhouii]
MNEPVEALLFDLDDTICEYCRPGSEILDLAFEDVGIEPVFTADDYYAVFEDHVEDSEDVVENRERCFAALAEEAGHDPDVGLAVADAYEAERDQTNVQWLPGAQEALDTLRERYAVAAVTNGGPKMQRAKMRGLGIDDHFETVVFAGYDVAAKPDPEPFEMALDAVGVGPERAVKVGNSLKNDVAGAHNAGLRSVWIDREGVPNPDPEPHHRIEAMDELLDEPWA